MRGGGTTVGDMYAHGAQDPIASNSLAAGRAANRRVDVTLRHRVLPLVALRSIQRAP